MLPPINFHQWINDHREQLKPPVANKEIYKDSDFIVMVVGGPNERTDFHINQTDEFFYQVEGDMCLKIRNEKKEIEDIIIKQGEIFMLKGGTPHSPQRYANTVGLVIEKTRSPNEKDGLEWYCQGCGEKLYSEFFELTNIEVQLGEAFDRYYGSEHMTCQKCGKVNGKTWEK